MIPAPQPSTTPGRVRIAREAVPPAADRLRIGTRGSALAVTQTTTVAQQIADATGLEIVLVIIKTKGDVSRESLAQLGGTGVFVSALRDALLANECDFAVHSLKDLPTGEHPGITLGAIPARVDARDALCARDGLTLDQLPAGARVGTGSPRRAAQILARRADLEVLDLRGNVDTRLARVGVDLDAVVLAAAGLQRLDRLDVVTERFGLDEAPTAPGQGALAIEVRASARAMEPYATALRALDDPATRACALAERSLLAALEAGCAAPIGAHAHLEDGKLHLRASVYRLDGSEQLTETATLQWSEGRDDVPALLGHRVCEALLARGAERLAPLRGAR